MTPELLRLLAYTGNAGARKALDWNDCRCVHRPCRVDCVGKQDMPDSDWISGLIPLHEAAATLECTDCDGGRWTAEGHECCHCETTTRVPDPHALLRLAVAVGWVCLLADESYLPTAREALRAADAYTEDPTEERRKACAEICSMSLADSGLPVWIWEILCWISDRLDGKPVRRGSRLHDALHAAIKVTGRLAVARCAVETQTEECPWPGHENPGLIVPCPVGCKGTGRVSR